MVKLASIFLFFPFLFLLWSIAYIQRLLANATLKKMGKEITIIVA